MSKVTWKPGAFEYPIPAVMVSCGNMEKSNIITVAWTGIINTNPPMVYVSIRPERYSYEIIKKNREFVINLTTEQLAYATDWCGVKSGIKEDKFKKMCSVLNSYETNHSEKFFYEIRNKDKNKYLFNRLSDYTRAGRTIYLNKACFNGLYRVNSKNEFNVPYGKKLKVNTYDGGNLITVSNYLTMNDIKILSVDFEEAVKDAKKVILSTLIRI